METPLIRGIRKLLEAVLTGAFVFLALNFGNDPFLWAVVAFAFFRAIQGY